jgi:succinyl-CoA synthetase beta subunit
MRLLKTRDNKRVFFGFLFDLVYCIPDISGDGAQIMKIHEYQGKAILAEYGVAVPKGKACFSVDEAVAAAQEIGGEKWVVKAQIHAGGRGKGGGVKLADSLDEVRQHASDILGMTLVTHQTGPEGKVVKRLLIEEGAPIQDELYIGLVVDRSTQRVTVMASSEGGTEIETVAEETPELIHKVSVDPQTGLTTAEAEGLAGKIGIADNLVPEAGKLIQALYQAFWDKDASLAEINPLITTSDDRVIALDAKINFDESAMYRHPELQDLRDLDEEDADETSSTAHRRPTSSTSAAAPPPNRSPRPSRSCSRTRT